MQHDLKLHEQAAAAQRRPRHGAGTMRLHHIPLKGKLALALFVAFTVLYFAYRIPLWNPQSPFLASALLAAELFGTFTVFLHVTSTWCLVERHAPKPPKDYQADLFITTWNESEDILRYTLLAAKQVSRARKIWLLDDGQRPAMAALAAELEVEYLAREDRSHAKAGNLNNALAQTDAEFIAIFDCDHAPSPEFLERTLGYFMDPSVGLVQTPQDFYNVDSFQHRASAKHQEAWHEQTLFYRVIQAGKDYWNATFFCGSCAIVRRQALVDIGGIATGTITEDMHTSLRLHKNGWSAVYHAEALAFGLSPADLEQYETQRLRWGRGAMQVWAKEGIIFTPGLTFAQRIAYLTSAITYFEGWQKAIVYILPIVVLTTGWMPIVWTGSQFLLLFAAWLITGMMVNEIFSRGYAKTIYMEEYNFLRFFTFVRATLALVIPRNWGFAVTPKNLASSTRFPLRLWPQVAVAAAALLSVPIGIVFYLQSQHLPLSALLANLVWVGLTASIAIKALRFATRRLQQRRSEHRFAVPFIAVLDIAGEAIPAVAENISSNGCRLACNDRLRLREDVVTGKLLLPSGELPFKAEVVGRFEAVGSQSRTLAARFMWETSGEADSLNACLYGNSLQWDVNNWAEVSRKSWLGSLLSTFSRGPQTPVPWTLGQLRADREWRSCLVRREGESFRILTTQPLPALARLQIAGENRSLSPDLAVSALRSYPMGNGVLHMAVLAQTAAEVPPIFHREPAWYSDKATPVLL